MAKINQNAVTEHLSRASEFELDLRTKYNFFDSSLELTVTKYAFNLSKFSNTFSSVRLVPALFAALNFAASSADMRCGCGWLSNWIGV